MDNINAPQWVDFNMSLMPDIDDYFNTDHSNLESRHKSDNSFLDSPDSKASASNSAHNTPSSNKVLLSSNTNASVSQTTLPITSSTPYLNKTNDSLANALNNLRIRSEKKIQTANLSMNADASRVKKCCAKLETSSKFCEIKEDNKIEETVVENVIDEPQKLECAEIPEKVNNEILQEIEATVKVLQLELSDVNVNVSGNDCTLTQINNNRQSTDLDKSTANIEKSGNAGIISEKLDSKIAVQINDEIPHQCEKLEMNNKMKKNEANPSELQAGLDPSKRTVKKKIEPTTNPAKGPTYSTRRYSFSKCRRRSGKYIPLAEAISKFQNGTPKRFRSTRHNDPNPVPLPKGKPVAAKLTCAQSPALRCKLRTRAVTVPNREEREMMQIQEIRKKRIKPNPIKKSIKNPPKELNRVQSKVDDAALMQPPKPLIKIENNMDSNKGTTMTNSSTNSQHQKQDMSFLATSILSNVTRKTIGGTPCKKTVLAVVPTDSGMKDFEILNFGVPVGGAEYKKVTRTVPFSFDCRNKEQDKKDKIKDVQNDNGMKVKTVFQARPAPRFPNATTRPTTSKTAPAKTTETVSRKTKNGNANKAYTIPCPFSFEKRDQLLQKKKKDMVNQLVEQEKNARIFHAKPAPEIKSVFVRGISSENLTTGDNPVDKRMIRGVSPKRRNEVSNQKSQVGNQENKPPNAPVNQQFPKLKNPMPLHTAKLKKTTK